MQPSIPTRQLIVLLHPDKAVYSVGESIRPRLQLRCAGSFPVEIRGFLFDWDDLAYTRPSGVHLIGPNGQDLLLPYQLPLASPGSGLSLGPGQDEWLILPISAHLHLRQFGEYAFWVKLAEAGGAVYESDHLTFNLVDAPASIDPSLFELRLSAVRTAFSVSEPVVVDSTFSNRSSTPVTVLTPQQDSFDGWVNPVYQFTVTDTGGRSLAIARRDGTMATPVYGEHSQLTVAPGASLRQRLQLPVFPKMRLPGRYRIRLTYLVWDRQVGKGGTLLDRPMDWDENVFRGRLESNELPIVRRAGAGIGGADCTGT